LWEGLSMIVFFTHAALPPDNSGQWMNYDYETA
jgi:hypothetical protein